MVNFSTYTFILPTKHRKTQYTLPFTLSLYQPNTVKHKIPFHLHFTWLTKHRKTQYIFSATVHFFHSDFTTYDLQRFVTKQTGPVSTDEDESLSLRHYSLSDNDWDSPLAANFSESHWNHYHYSPSSTS